MTTAASMDAARRVLDAHWRDDAGYTCPNARVYPWLWLWDSCFHALVWAELGGARAVTELSSVFRWQTDEGFVPHMGYQLDPDAARKLWGRAGASTITQPPMYGHAARRLAAAGLRLPGALLAAIRRAFVFLWTHRRADNGLLSVIHPWEGGNDDSPRWDAWCDGPFDRFGAWAERKREIARTVVTTPTGASVANPQFTVQAAGFNALCAFNLAEFAELTGDGELLAWSGELAAALDRRWDGRLATWTDASEADAVSGQVRTLDALLPVLVTRRADARDAVWRQLSDEAAFGAAYGPRGVHLAEPGYDPAGYWRGAAWPQLNYLFWVAASRQGRQREARLLARRTAAAARRSGHAEYWHPDTAEPFGAVPQSWATLWVAMRPAPEPGR